MGMLTREALLTKQELNREKVELNEEGYVYVTELTGKERDHFERSILKRVTRNGRTQTIENLENVKGKLLALTICDENGNKLFQLNDAANILEAMGTSTVEKLVLVAQRINGMQPLEEAEKNSDGDTIEDSNLD